MIIGFMITLQILYSDIQLHVGPVITLKSN